MAVQPAPAPVLALTPNVTDTEVSDLMRALETERSAGRALLTALRDLETNLGHERRRVAELEVEKAQAAGDASEAVAELERQRTITCGLFAQVEDARMALEYERTRPFFQRLFNR